jgi:hypothetical protein
MNVRAVYVQVENGYPLRPRLEAQPPLHKRDKDTQFGALSPRQVSEIATVAASSKNQARPVSASQIARRADFCVESPVLTE